MKRIIPIFILFSFYFVQAYAQNKDFTTANFPTKPIELQQAQNDLSEGMKLFSEGKIRYKRALPFLEKANGFNPNNAILNYNIATCYMFSSFKNKAKVYFEKAFELDNNVAQDIHYWLGMSNHLSNNWDKARKEYQMHKDLVLQSKNDDALKIVNKRLEEVNIAQERVKKPVKVKIENLGPEINSPYTDYGPIISSDEDVLMLTSRRPGTTSGPEGDKDEYIDEYWEDIYQSFSFGNKWTKAKNIGPPVNTDVHDATNNLSPSGEKLFINIDDQGQGDIYECDLVNLQWSKPSRMRDPINTKSHESSATISKGLDTLYFISERPGGYGGGDIYMAIKDAKSNKWGSLSNVGPTLNTDYDEEGVFLMPDSKTMYFSSRGHTSMGGFDIFKTVKVNGVWSKPENIGYPINTSDDDVFFVISGSGYHGYFASSKQGGYGDKDIYKITFLGNEKSPVLMNEDNLLASVTAPISEFKAEKIVSTGPKMTILKGVISDDKTKIPLDATIELIDNTLNEVIATFHSNATTGKYLVSLPSGKNYGIAVKKDGYLFHSENFDLITSQQFQEVIINVALKQIDIGQSIILKNIFFDFDKATIRMESANELDRLIKLLTDNPTLKIELGSHTDSKGSDDYNQKLSQSRSQSVVNYLIGKGILTDRLVAKGYGETAPVATNDTELGRQENRRTDFKILSK